MLLQQSTTQLSEFLWKSASFIKGYLFANYYSIYDKFSVVSRKEDCGYAVHYKLICLESSLPQAPQNWRNAEENELCIALASGKIYHVYQVRRKVKKVPVYHTV